MKDRSHRIRAWADIYRILLENMGQDWYGYSEQNQVIKADVGISGLVEVKKLAWKGTSSKEM